MFSWKGFTLERCGVLGYVLVSQTWVDRGLTSAACVRISRCKRVIQTSWTYLIQGETTRSANGSLNTPPALRETQMLTGLHTALANESLLFPDTDRGNRRRCRETCRGSVRSGRLSPAAKYGFCRCT